MVIHLPVTEFLFGSRMEDLQTDKNRNLVKVSLVSNKNYHHNHIHRNQQPHPHRMQSHIFAFKVFLSLVEGNGKSCPP